MSLSLFNNKFRIALSYNDDIGRQFAVHIHSEFLKIFQAKLNGTEVDMLRSPTGSTLPIKTHMNELNGTIGVGFATENKSGLVMNDLVEMSLVQDALPSQYGFVFQFISVVNGKMSATVPQDVVDRFLDNNPISFGSSRTSAGLELKTIYVFCSYKFDAREFTLTNTLSNMSKGYVYPTGIGNARRVYPIPCVIELECGGAVYRPLFHEPDVFNKNKIVIDQMVEWVGLVIYKDSNNMVGDMNKKWQVNSSNILTNSLYCLAIIGVLLVGYNGITSPGMGTWFQTALRMATNVLGPDSKIVMSFEMAKSYIGDITWTLPGIWLLMVKNLNFLNASGYALYRDLYSMFMGGDGLESYGNMFGLTNRGPQPKNLRKIMPISGNEKRNLEGTINRKNIVKGGDKKSLPPFDLKRILLTDSSFGDEPPAILKALVIQLKLNYGHYTKKAYPMVTVLLFVRSYDGLRITVRDLERMYTEAIQTDRICYDTRGTTMHNIWNGQKWLIPRAIMINVNHFHLVNYVTQYMKYRRDGVLRFVNTQCTDTQYVDKIRPIEMKNGIRRSDLLQMRTQDLLIRWAGNSEISIGARMTTLESREKTAIITGSVFSDLNRDETDKLIRDARTGTALNDMRWVESRYSKQNYYKIRKANNLTIKSMRYGENMPYVLVFFRLDAIIDFDATIYTYYATVASSMMQCMYYEATTSYKYKSEQINLPDLIMLDGRNKNVRRLLKVMFKGNEIISLFDLAYDIGENRMDMVDISDWGIKDKDVISFAIASIILFQSIPKQLNMEMIRYMQYKSKRDTERHEIRRGTQLYTDAIKFMCSKYIRGEFSSNFMNATLRRLRLNKGCGMWPDDKKLIFIANLPFNDIAANDVFYSRNHYTERSKLWCFNLAKRMIRVPEKVSVFGSIFHTKKVIVPRYVLISMVVFEKSALWRSLKELINESFGEIVAGTKRDLANIVDAESYPYRDERNYAVLVAILLNIRIDFVLNTRGQLINKGLTPNDLWSLEYDWEINNESISNVYDQDDGEDEFDDIDEEF